MGWVEESKDDTSLPVVIRLCSISTEVQATYVAYVQWQELSKLALYYFQSQTGIVIDNDTIMVRLFIGSLKGVAFDWFRSLPNGSINF